MFQQSVAYVLVATILNTVCLALFYLALNPLMGYICSPMAMTLSGILGQCSLTLTLNFSKPC